MRATRIDMNNRNAINSTVTIGNNGIETGLRPMTMSMPAGYRSRLRSVLATEPFVALLAAPRAGALALLHSCGAGPTWLLRDPVETLELAPGEWRDALQRIDGFLERHRERRCAGWLGYDLRDAVEALPRTIADDFPVPLASLTAYATVESWPSGPVPPPPHVEPARDLRLHCTRSDYERRVARIVEHIREGDIFQANLTQPFTARFSGDPRALFWRLCAVSPAPFAAYLQSPSGVCVLSSSPEEFLFRDGDRVRTRPIKGTRPRGADAAADQALLADLLRSEKDRAELAMIVDLLRNDLSKLALPGSVRVGPFPEHHSYAQVHHLFATVTATLRQGTSAAALLRATMPGGSVTGAPKLRCMEILEQQELVRRGVYTGAIGWFGPGERLHLNVAIRTIVWQDGIARFHAGGGVTARSDPGEEYEETLHKAAGMLAALQLELPRG
jgi:para-aminobenzoate synthetase component 1